MSDSGKTILITQSNYIPWKGYFDNIARSDIFVVYDDVQYTRRDWRNRNQIKTDQGLKWLTIPVKVKGRYNQLIEEVQVANHDWPQSHLTQLRQNYKHAGCFDDTIEWLEPIYAKAAELEYLTEINLLFIRAVLDYLGIKTRIKMSSSMPEHDDPTQRLVSICKELGGDEYISGPAAKEYMDETAFQEADITLTYADYEGYPEYEQLYHEFKNHVTILDLIMNKGKFATNYMKYISE